MQRSLSNAFPIIARYFCDDLGVRIEFGGNQPATKDKVIYQPVLKDESPRMVNVSLGWTAHESAHIKYSDDEPYELAYAVSPFMGRFLNLLEDLRIEKRMMEDHYCAIEPLRVTAQEVFHKPWSADGKSEAVVLHDACLIIGRARLLNQPIEEVAVVLDAALANTFGAGRRAKILGLLSTVTGLPDTAGVYQLAHRILDVLDEEEPQQPDAGTDPDPTPQGQDQGPQQGQAQPGQGGDQGDSGDSDQAGQDGAEAASGQPGADKQGTQPSLKQRVVNADSQAMQDALGDVSSQAATLIGANAGGTSSTPSSVLAHAVGSQALQQDVVINGRAASMGLRQVLNGLIQGSQNARVTVRKTGSRLDTASLARVRVGENRIFRKQEPVQRTNAAIQLLLDGSGSMGGKTGGRKPIQVAEEACFAMLTALEGIAGVTSGAMVFPRGDREQVGVLKRHGQNLASAVAEQRFGLTASGGTPLASAMWPAAGDLLRAKGQRKVLIISTDGDPRNVTDVIDMVARCRASGIEVFAIAYGDANATKLQQMFGTGHWQLLDDLGQLRSALQALVQRVLTQAA
ncbi:VWA domain-containing protein [Pseudomonas oryzihabitans]|uniref:von Willebrand factor type A domain-containing protein n=1 Tax=Pseudomonas oryzihabitans TaxID=47885 RepID=A0A1G5PHA2_9PSED|nr:VWA domain-containing protein [Pseudomonas psychrotolerans]NMY92745.1 VWA domain-containing protein [Pseudomonas psychrotolerans]SCZ48856.1 von Willebrand factor type A domain-containing protein [Pseudomonas psychrotolerans]